MQPGVRNLAISEAAAAHGLYYAPDPSSQIACSIGGNVAENAGGVHCLKYGLTVHNVRRVRGVLITGEVVEFGGDALDSSGYDLLALVDGQRRPARRDHRDHGQAHSQARNSRKWRSRHSTTSERRAPQSAPSSPPASFLPGSR